MLLFGSGYIRSNRGAGIFFAGSYRCELKGFVARDRGADGPWPASQSAVCSPYSLPGASKLTDEPHSYDV